MPEYAFNAGSPLKLLEQLAADTRVREHFSPYGEYADSTRRKHRPILLELLKVVTGGDLYGFINDALTPYEVAEHIFPANKVFVCISITIALANELALRA